MTPSPGDFAVCKISGDVGKLISIGEWLDGSGFTDWDHAEVFVGHADLQNPWGYTASAYPEGAKLVPLQSWQLESTPHQYLWSTGKFDLTTAERDAIVATALALLGTPYSALDYFALAAHRLHIPVPGLRRYIADTHHLICSQYTDLCYQQAGVHLFQDGRWNGYVTPAALAELILATG